MEKELVSVIIPTYNRKHTIKRSIDSVLAQTYRAFEIIIIDDCSTDGTMEYVNELYGDITDVNIIYVKNDNNIGPGASRNIGVSYASGEYIAFHDSDDEWLPHKLEKQMGAMLQADDKVGVVYSISEMQKAEKTILYPSPEIPLVLKSGAIFPVTLLNAVIPMITLLMKKSVFLEMGGFNEQLNALEDYELSIRVAREYEILLVDEVLAIWHESPNNVSSRWNDVIVTQYYIMDLYREELGRLGLKKRKFDYVLGEAMQYGNQRFFCQSVLQLSKDEDYLRYAREWWEKLYPASNPEKVDTTTIEGVKACTGCMACFNECPVDAIHMEQNREGFSVPVVDENQCIQCGKCKQVCPVCNETPGVLCSDECYAVMGSDEIRKLCSSGGVFGVLAEKMLEEGGCVSGAVWDENWQVEHIVSKDAEDIRRMYSSKYVQSDIKDTYRQIRDLLEDGQKVLFSGCGCQVAGLKRYLQKEYENLLTVDVVCHGVPSQEVWNTWLEQDILQSSGRTKEEIAEISFRKKEALGWNSGIYIRYQDGAEKVQNGKESAYMAVFLNNWALRECCYACQFKNKKYSDITLGDFWGINQIYQFDDELGTSFVTVNTTKGAVFFKSVLGRFKKIVGLRTASAVQFNPCISGSVEKPISRDIFFSEWKNPGITLEGCLQKAKDQLHFDFALVCMWSMNYGNAITNYALYTYIKKQGKQPIMLDNYCSLQPKEQFLQFAKAHYVMSSSYFPAYDYLLVNKACDAFLVCSDQVWNYAYAGIYGYGGYFQLDFAEDDKKRIAYASSFGSPEYAMPAESGKELYEKFDAISVRESFGVALCKKLYDVDAVRVVDPVFLLEQEDYDKLIENASETEPYIVVYMLNPTAEKRQLCLDLRQKLGGIKIVNLMDANPQYRDYGMRILEYDNIKLDLTVEEWLSYLRNAEYVITDSFHGTCFSVIFGKRFATVKARESERFETFSAFPELKGRILEDGASYDVDKLLEEIDYSAVYRRLEEEKEASKDYIRKYIL